MELSIWLSIIATLIAITSFYRKQFRPAKIKIYTAERVAIWHEKGTLGFDAPIILTNVGSKPGVIHLMAVLLYNPKDKSENFFLKWLWFLRFQTEPQKSWRIDGPNFPIPIMQGETILKCINFMSAHCKKNWIPKPGKYKIKILGWSKKGTDPNVQDEFFIDITEENSQQITKNISEGNTNSTYVYRSDWSKFKSKNLHIDELNELVN